MIQQKQTHVCYSKFDMYPRRVKYYTPLIVFTNSYFTVNGGIQELDIAVGLKQLLIDANFTIESIIDRGYRQLSEMLHIDPYIGKLIVEVAESAIQERNLSQDIS
jgi:hypothetical protein